MILTRDVAIHLRGGKVHKEREMTPPPIKGAKRDARSVELAAIANVATVLRWVDEILEYWAQEPADALRAGGGQDFFLVGLRLTREDFHRRHRDDADARAEFFAGREGERKFAARADENQIRLAIWRIVDDIRTARNT